MQWFACPYVIGYGWIWNHSRCHQALVLKRVILWSHLRFEAFVRHHPSGGYWRMFYESSVSAAMDAPRIVKRQSCQPLPLPRQVLVQLKHGCFDAAVMHQRWTCAKRITRPTDRFPTESIKYCWATKPKPQIVALISWTCVNRRVDRRETEINGHVGASDLL